jgi:uncharacterized protein YbjT (DUF2867 family)
MSEISTVLAIGATGTIGRLVVGELLARGLTVRALVRDPERARRVLSPEVAFAVGDMATGEGLTEAVAGVDAIVFTHGGESRDVDYDGVRRVLEALGGAKPRISLMTSMSVSQGGDHYGGLMHWKRRAERLVRAYGAPYTVTRPGWFDLQGAGQNAVLMEQGDNSAVESRRGLSTDHLAKTLVEALFVDAAVGKTFELFSQDGEPQSDWNTLFDALLPDDAAQLAGGGDGGVRLGDEPAEVLADIAAIRALSA